MNSLLPLVLVASPFVAGGIIFLLREEQRRLRITINVSVAVLKIGILALMLWQVAGGYRFEVRFALAPGVEFALTTDPFALLFATLSTGLWFVTTIYSIGYLEDSPNRSRFFGYFSWCVCATTGIALSANLVTFLFFYEMLTLTTYPLVVHRGTDVALRAGRVYLSYTVTAGTVLLVAIIWLRTIVGATDFATGGLVRDAARGNEISLRIIFVMLVLGFGVKAALVPLHGWLPKAMIAPAPVSALLHAVAVVKAGAFGIVRTIYDVFGVGLSSELGLLMPLAVLASITIIWGSLRAMVQEDLKRRLAYSTVSQLSYIVLGVSLFGPFGSIGGIVHIVHQAIMKITLFFAAGNLSETLDIHDVSELNGVGARMPWTMAAFTVCSLGMIGVAPLAGFISKWYLGQGALESGQDWVIVLLVASSFLNAIYFLPLVYAAWFKPPQASWPQRESKFGFECSPYLLLPPLFTALLTILTGVFAGIPLGPLEWAHFITDLEYRP